MALSEDAMLQIRHETIGDDGAIRRWHAAWNALHAYARASGCLPGGDVLAWFTSRTTAYQDALSAAIQNAAAAPKDTPS